MLHGLSMWRSTTIGGHAYHSAIPEAVFKLKSKQIISQTQCCPLVSVKTSSDGVHRVGAMRPGKPCGMIVRLFKREVRMNILKSRTTLKGSGLVVAEDLTVQNAQLLNRASRHERIHQAWSWNNKIWAVGKNGNRIRVTLGCNIDELLNASNL